MGLSDQPDTWSALLQYFLFKLSQKSCLFLGISYESGFQPIKETVLRESTRQKPTKPWLVFDCLTFDVTFKIWFILNLKEKKFFGKIRILLPCVKVTRVCLHGSLWLFVLHDWSPWKHGTWPAKDEFNERTSCPHSLICSVCVICTLWFKCLSVFVCLADAGISYRQSGDECFSTAHSDHLHWLLRHRATEDTGTWLLFRRHKHTCVTFVVNINKTSFMFPGKSGNV